MDARPTIYDVAAVAEVSHTTVSRVLNGGRETSAATREKVERAIAAVGFAPSNLARALANSRTTTVGVLVDMADHEGSQRVARSVERAARQHGYQTRQLTQPADGGFDIGADLATLDVDRIDALIVVAPRFSSLIRIREREWRIPVVIVGDARETRLVHSVAVDHARGVASAVQHLAALGHTKVVHLSGPQAWTDAHARERAWRDATARLGLDARVVAGDWTSDSGYLVALGDALGDATAVFASNDLMALGVIHALSDRGIRVPDDVSVVGYDDASIARHTWPPLTTVRQDFDRAGAAAVEAIATGSARTSAVRLLPSLVIRESSGPVRGIRSLPSRACAGVA